MATEAAALAVQREHAARALQEEESWEVAAAAADEGRGIHLLDVDLNDQTLMKEVYEALNVTGPGPKSRLRTYIRRLQKQHEEQPNGKLRCCFCILVLSEVRVHKNMRLHQCSRSESELYLNTRFLS
jgi:hypothetical protein